MATSSTQKKVDEYLLLKKKIGKHLERIQKDVERVKELEESFQIKADSEYLPEETPIFKGTTGHLEVGMKAIKTFVDVPKVFSLLKKEKFLQIATVQIKELKAELTDEQIASATYVERIGKRSIKLIYTP